MPGSPRRGAASIYAPLPINVGDVNARIEQVVREKNLSCPKPINPDLNFGNADDRYHNVVQLYDDGTTIPDGQPRRTIRDPVVRYFSPVPPTSHESAAPPTFLQQVLSYIAPK